MLFKQVLYTCFNILLYDPSTENLRICLIVKHVRAHIQLNSM